MTILNSFYFRFFTNANDAVKDVGKIEAQTDKLQKKVSKGDKDAQESRRKAKAETQEQIKTNDRLADSFLGVASRIAAPFGIALGAYEIFGKAVGTAGSVTKMNIGLERTKMLTGQNSIELSKYNKLFGQFGDMTDVAEQRASQLYEMSKVTGSPVVSVDEFYKNINQQFQGKSRGTIASMAGQLGLTPQETIGLSLPTEKFDELAKAQEEFTKTTEAATKAAGEFDQNLKNINTTIEGKYTQGLTDAMTGFNFLVKEGAQSFFDVWRNTVTTPENRDATSGVRDAVNWFTGHTPSGNSPPVDNSEPAPVILQNEDGSYLDESGKLDKNKAMQYLYGPQSSLFPSDISGLDKANLALNEADSSGAFLASNNITGGSKSIDLNIQNITIETAATDAKGIASDIKNQLQYQVQNLINNWDDGLVA